MRPREVPAERGAAERRLDLHGAGDLQLARVLLNGLAGWPKLSTSVLACGAAVALTIGLRAWPGKHEPPAFGSFHGG